MTKKRLIPVICALSMMMVACAGTTNEATNSDKVADEILEENVEADDKEESTEVIEKEDEAEELVALEVTDDISLKDVFAEHGMKAGTCLAPQMIAAPNASKILLEQFSSVTLENAMKPDFIINRSKSQEAGDIVVEFNKDAIKLLDFAKDNGLAVRGHTLVWYSQTPDYIFYEDFDTSKELVTRETMLARMDSYIKQVFEYLIDNGYADMFYAYDVVNEAVMEDGTLRDNLWRQIIGDDYIYYAFSYAKQYAPDNIALFYNDYNEQYKADALVKLIDSLKDDEGNYVIDGIGLQAHLYTLDDMNKYFKAVDKLASTGLRLEVTELDVGLGAWQNILEANDSNLKSQGKFYYNLIKGLLERKDAGQIDMDSLTFWGFADSMSWRKEYSPLLYDASFNPKYAYYGAAQITSDF